MPNADHGNKVIIKENKIFCATKYKFLCLTSMGQRNYLSAMKYVVV